MAADKERGPGSVSADIEKFLDILAKDPKSRVFAPLAEAYRKGGFLDDAVATALEGLKVHPNYLGGRVALGRAYFEKNQLAEAAEEMGKVVKAAPENIIAHKVLGKIAQTQGDLPAAEKSFRKVLLLDPQDKDALEFVASFAQGVPEAARPMPAPPPSRAAAASPEAPPAAMPAAPSPDDFGAISFDEIQSFEDHPPATAAAPPPAAAPPIEFVAFADESPPPAPARAAPPQAAPPQTGSLLPPPPVALSDDVVPPGPGEIADVFPNESFDRPLHEGQPTSAEGEEPEPAKLDLDDLSAGPPPEPQPEPQIAAPSGAEPEFEIFTRTPGPHAPADPSRPGQREFAGPREAEIETTAYNPPETFVPIADDASVLTLDDELPHIDLASEVEVEEAEQTAPPAGTAEEVTDFDDVWSVGEGSEEAVEVQGVAEIADAGEGAAFAAVEEVEEGEEIEEIEDIEPQTRGDGMSARDIFETATLADIYIKQGFFGRAAEIYRRLIEQRPGDLELQRKLEAVLALEGGAAAAAAPVRQEAAPTAYQPPAAGREQRAGPSGAPHEEKVRRLETLLEAFRGGRQ